MIAATLRAGFDSPRTRWLAAGLALFFVCVHIAYIAKLSHSDNGSRSAFLRWRVQLQDLDDGVNVWDKYAYPNPPIMAMILQPFLKLSPLLGASLWFYFKAILALASIFLVLALLDRQEQPMPWWGKILAVALTLRPIEGDLVHGNVNLFILFLVVVSLGAYCARREYLAGFVLGLAIACKLTPALFLPYFFWKRAWRTLIGAAAGMLLFVLVIPALVHGWSENLGYLKSWHRQMIAPYAAGVVTSEHKNQSLPGLAHRMLADEPSFSDYEGDRRVTVDTHNFASLSRSTVHAIVVGCMALYLALAAWACRTPAETRPSLLLLAEFSVVLLGMLVFCERTWKHHCVLLLLPFGVLAHALFSDLSSRGMRWYLGITLGTVALLMLATTSGHVDVGVDSDARVGKWMQVYGAYTWAFLLLLAAHIVLLTFARPRSRTQERSLAHAHTSIDGGAAHEVSG